MSKNVGQLKTAAPAAATEDNAAKDANAGAEAKTAEKQTAAPGAPPKSIIREYFESFVITLIMAFFGMTFIVQAVTVPTGSMQNTINIGDNLLVNKFIYAPGPPLPFLPMREVRRGDIVVFKYPGNQFNPQEDRDQGIVPLQTNYVKRVVGLPGDTIEFRENQVFINGKLLPENRLESNNPRVTGAIDTKEFEQRPPDANYTVYYWTKTMDVARRGALDESEFNFGVAGKPSVVPPDSYFVMGDNRDNSADSRVWGFVQRDLIVGRAMFIYWSCDRSTGDTFLECLTHPRFDRIGKLVK